MHQRRGNEDSSKKNYLNWKILKANLDSLLNFFWFIGNKFKTNML